MRTTTPTSFFPKAVPSLKLVTTGATIGPLVDSLHNQCLLEYDRAPIDIPNNLISISDNVLNMDQATSSFLFRTSWYIPPLLGVAYLVLGAILPRIITTLLAQIQPSSSLPSKTETATTRGTTTPTTTTPIYGNLQNKAILAVTSTALIIKLSEFLETTSNASPETNLFIMTLAALSQWAVLDRTIPALITATIVAIGGPLSELPFVATGFWHYLPDAADYFPLAGLGESLPISSSSWIASILPGIGDNISSYKDLALSSITGPCYFAVTMDAIALGRWFDHQTEEVS